MPCDISKYVVCGEVYSTRRNTVQGWLGLQGWKISYMFELTGNSGENMMGHSLRFETSISDECPNGGKPGITRKLRDRDIGVVERFDLDPTEEGDGYILHMEWYGQLGHMLVRLEDVRIEIDPAAPEQEDELEMSFDEVTNLSESYEPTPLPDSWEVDEETGLISSPDVAESLEDESFIAEMELMDRLIDEEVKGMRLATLFDEYGLPSPDEVSEEEAEKLMKRILATLAQFGTAIHLCEHYNWRQAYRMMHEDLDDATFHPQLKGTGWVQNYMSHEYCPICEEESELEFQRYNESFDVEDSDE